MSNLLDIDRRLIWHPFTQHATERDPIPVTQATGATLYREDGREILDLISSWWTCIHGHGHPALVQALAEQAAQLDHVMFAGFTHSPATRLAQALTARLPGGLSRVFFSDDGSTAVEVALKLAYQYWCNRGDEDRNLFLAFDGGYHGDTLGAMSLGRGSGFFSLFQNLMYEVNTLPYPATWQGDTDVEAREAEALSALKQNLHERGDHIAAIIMEPMLQGAGGMRMCRPEFVAAVTETAREAGVLVVFDEVATGFGRTGTLFACEQAGVAPDIICLSKGLTAGMLPMSLTVTREDIYEGFLGEGFDKALAHGHSFTANPLACAVALRSLQLFDEENTLDRIRHVGLRHGEMLRNLDEHRRVRAPRQCGTVLAFDLHDESEGYKSKESEMLRDWFLEQGLNIRPLGSTLYLMPPYCITDAELSRAYDGLMEGLERLG